MPAIPARFLHRVPQVALSADGFTAAIDTILGPLSVVPAPFFREGLDDYKYEVCSCRLTGCHAEMGIDHLPKHEHVVGSSSSTLTQFS